MKSIVTKFSLCTFLLLFVFAFSATAQDKFTYSEDKPVEGQLHTAELLQKAMADKDYDTAIALFSKEQQTAINKMRKEKKEDFEFWCKAWGLQEGMFEYYSKKINKQKAAFVFEDGAWKINEK